MQVTPSSSIVTPKASASTTTSSIPTAAASTATSAASSASASPTVDYNSFLKLLVAELKNQDPTTPTDPTQYMSQLASFSAVGQTVQTNQKLDAMLTTSALSQADGAVGRTLTSADGNTSGKIVSVSIGTGGAATAVLDSGATIALGSGVVVS